MRVAEPFAAHAQKHKAHILARLVREGGAVALAQAEAFLLRPGREDVEKAGASEWKLVDQDRRAGVFVNGIAHGAPQTQYKRRACRRIGAHVHGQQPIEPTIWLDAPRQTTMLTFVTMVSDALTKINIDYENCKNTSFVKELGDVVTAGTAALVKDGARSAAQNSLTLARRYPKDVLTKTGIRLPASAAGAMRMRLKGAKDPASPFPRLHATSGASRDASARLAAEDV